MKASRRADVVVPVYRDVALTMRCLESVLEHSGDALRALIIVDDAGPEPEMRPRLRELRARDGRVRLIENEQNVGFVASSNRGLSVRGGDVVLLNSDTEVTADWLVELLEVLHAEERIAAVTPLSNNATLASVPAYGRGTPVAELRVYNLELEGLPRWTVTPTAVGFCLAMRDELLNLVGLLDPIYGRGYNEENDWCQRVQSLGFSVARANRCLVYHHGEVSFQGARAELDEHNARKLIARFPSYLAQNRDFEAGPHARVAAIGVAAQVRKLRVCLDLSHLVAPAIHGTAVYGLQLAFGLAQQDTLELTVRAGSPAMHEVLAAAGVKCVPATAKLKGYDVVHKPTQVYSQAELAELLSAEGHLVFTWQDLIAFRAPGALGDFERTRTFRSLTWAALSAAQGVLAISDVAASELRALMPSISPRLTRVHLGVDPAAAPAAEAVRRVCRELSLPERYVVHAGNDYPHKNLELLLEAWPLVPSALGLELVIAGPPSRLLGGLYTSGRRLPPGVRILGELPAHAVLPVIAGARAVVLPSVYEGFGLSALEAMCCRVPVITAGISGLDEVAGEAGFKLETFTPSELASAVTSIVSQPELSARLIAAGSRRVGRFNWSATARETAAFYQRVARAPDLASLDARDALRRLLSLV